MLSNVRFIKPLDKSAISRTLKHIGLSRNTGHQKWLNSPNGKKLATRFEATSASHVLDGDFDYNEFKLARKAFESPLNNDFYAFKMAAGFFLERAHQTHQVTSRVFSRGHEKRNYLLAFGQDQVIDLLENLHFTDAEITMLKNHSQLSLYRGN